MNTTKATRTDIEIVRDARKFLEIGRDYTLAAYVVRDLQATEDAGMKDMAWAMHNNYHVRSEAKWLLDELEKFMEENGLGNEDMTNDISPIPDHN